MSFKPLEKKVTIYLKNAQAYLKEVHDLCAVKICPEWDAVEYALNKTDKYVTKIINEAKDLT
jgi:hypothetical protein